TVVTKRKSGPSWSRAAAATRSFCVDAGASARSGARPYTAVDPSSTTRQLRTGPRAASNRAASRPAASVGGGGAGRRAVVGGAVGGGGGGGEEDVVSATVVVVVGSGGTERNSA